MGYFTTLRLDELPQLLNVLNGESLIGPRPERPELEHDLERIPHYRKRHWTSWPERLGSGLCFTPVVLRILTSSFLMTLLLAPLQHSSRSGDTPSHYQNGAEGWRAMIVRLIIHLCLSRFSRC